MVDGAAQKSGERGLPFLLAQEQSKAKRERERDGRPDADRPAPGHERPPRDKALPPHWEGDKIEGTDVTAAGTPRMQSSPDEEEGRPPPETTQTCPSGDQEAGTTFGTRGQDLPEMLGGTRTREGWHTLEPRP